MSLHLTDSEVLALRDVVASYIRQPDRVDSFVDVVRDVETTPEQLLVRLLEAPEGAAPNPTPSIRVHGIWLRRLGERVEVLAETEPGKWRRIISEPHDAAFSHCAHPNWIALSPLVPELSEKS